MTKTSQGLSLFGDYKQRWSNLGFGFGGDILTEESADIFATHIRAEKMRHLSRLKESLHS